MPFYRHRLKGARKAYLAVPAAVLLMLTWKGTALGGIEGSRHDFSNKAALAPGGRCSPCHNPHYAVDDQAKAIWSRDLAQERSHFDQVTDPDYTPIDRRAILCYDCHDDRTTVDTNPAPALITWDTNPQDIAFSDGPGGVVGYYELSDGSRPGHPTTPPVDGSPTGGHYWKHEPEPTAGWPDFKKGDKIHCTMCHDPHDAKTGAAPNKNEVFFRTSTPDGRGGTITMGDGLDASGNCVNGSGNGRAMCAKCHAYSDSGTPVTMWNINLNTLNMTDMGDHKVGSSKPCTDCHKHNYTTASCTTCHGYPPSLPPYAAAGYDTIAIPNGIDETLGPHGKHAQALADGGYGMSCGTGPTVCHNTESAAHANYASDSYNDVFFLSSRNTSSASYDSGSRVCSNLYCHSRGTSFDDKLNGAGADTIAWTDDSWNTTDLTCAACHGGESARTAGDMDFGAPAYGNGTPKANSHEKHKYRCSLCHWNVTRDAGPNGTTGWTIYYNSPSDNGRLNHVNNTSSSFTYNVNPDPGATNKFTGYTYSSGGGVCSAIDCHGAESAQWGDSLGCTDCHGADSDVNKWTTNWGSGTLSPAKISTSQFTGSGHGRTGIGLACESCHDVTVIHDTSADLSGDNPFRLGTTYSTYSTPNAFCSDTDNCHTTASASIVVTHDRDNMDAPKRTWPTWRPKCWDCHDPHGDQSNLAMVQEDVFDQGSTSHGVPTVPKTTDIIDFTTKGGLSVGSYADQTDANGICQECHSAINPNPILSFIDGDTAVLHGGHPTSALNPCTACHKHDKAFEGSACEQCHNGGTTAPLAPNVMTYWTGSISGLQEGGHGDPDGRESGSASLTPKCTDCHNIGDPPLTHGDGIVQSAESGSNQNANTAHLKASYMLTGTPSNEYDIQLKLDEPCWQCHLSYSSTYAILNHRPNASGTPPLSITHRGNTILNVVEFGRGITPADGAIIKWPVDSDITTRANGGKTYASCASCHNPHGTNTPPEGADSNHMARDVYYGNNGMFCVECHR